MVSGVRSQHTWGKEYWSDAPGHMVVEGREEWSDYVIFSNAWVKKKNPWNHTILKDANKPVIFLRWDWIALNYIN